MSAPTGGAEHMKIFRISKYQYSSTDGYEIESLLKQVYVDAGFTDQSVAVEELIKNLEEKLRHAMIAGNVEDLKELIHDELQFSIPTGDIVSKEDDIEGYIKSLKKFESIKFNSQLIKVLDGSVLTITNATVKGNYLDSDITGNYSYFRLWVLSDESWKVIAGQVSFLSKAN